ncbi:MAG: hypothetical protein JRI72_03955 [Deltaproteobacteria bacterium]|nr:hypothetical protein [Deltaproteobacteria bacterium]
MNHEEQKEKVKEIDGDPDDEIILQNTDLNLPSGAYHRIAMQATGFNIDICTPASGSITFGQLVDQAVYLAIFSSDDGIKDIVRKELLKSLNNPKPKGGE